MSLITGDDDDEVAREVNAAIEAAHQCVDRGEGFNPCHVYVDGSGKCQCGRGPVLDQRRLK